MSTSPTQTTLLEEDVELEHEAANQIWSRITLQDEAELPKPRALLPSAIRNLFGGSSVRSTGQRAEAESDAHIHVPPVDTTVEWLHLMPHGMASEGPIAIFHA